MNLWLINKRKLQFGAACFILGFAIGTAASIFYSGAVIDEKVFELDTLYSELSERTRRIEKLEESLADQRSRIIKDLKVVVTIKDPHLNLKISDAVRQILSDLIGQEIAGLDPGLIRSIIDGRIIYISGEPYTLHLQYLVVAETAVLEISAEAGS